MRKQLDTKLVTAASLAVLMGVTRLGHFGHGFHPPDASWAVFVLAGAWLGGTRVFLALCAVAGASDLAAFSLGTSTACMSAAYVFLVPTYATLFWAGRWASREPRLPLLRVAAATVLGALGAFTISNASFFALAPRFEHMSASTFTVHVAPYLLPYLTTTLVYATAGQTLRLIPRGLPWARARWSSDVS
ncbi:MAG TPA: hypothetical protein VF331_14655 [Polyangiales bacterium]